MRNRSIVPAVVGVVASFVFALTSAVPADAIVDGAEAAHLNGAVQLWGDNERGPNSFFCTGSLIRSDVVLTAKHCLQTRGGTPLYSPSQVTIRAGDRQLGGGQVHRATEFVMAGWDQAIIKLDSGVTNMPILALPAAGYTPGININLAASGWGVTTFEDRSPSPRLKVCTLKVTSTGGRGLVVERVDGIPHNMDSGGPLVQDGYLHGTLVSTDSATHTIAHYISTGNRDIRRWISRHAGV